MLKINGLKKHYGNGKGIVTKAVDGIDLEIKAGEFAAIMGASGSGKSTLLNMVAAIDTPSEGHIYLDGTDISRMSEKDLAEFRGNHIGFVFQDYNLLDVLTVYENIALSLTMQNKPVTVIRERVDRIARTFGIEALLDKYPYEISGGQRQRAACARAVIKEPKIILADEPTGALDSKSAAVLMETLEVMNREWSCTVLMVTHDAFSASYCEKILFLRDGRIFNRIVRADKTRRDFFNEILDVLALWGGVE